MAIAGPMVGAAVVNDSPIDESFPSLSTTMGLISVVVTGGGCVAAWYLYGKPPDKPWPCCAPPEAEAEAEGETKQERKD